MAQVHHRAPVIVAQEAFDFWLDCGKVDEKTAAALIAPAPEGSMEVYEISTRSTASWLRAGGMVAGAWGI